MNMSLESRSALKTAVTNAVQKLKIDFPLQSRSEGAQPTLQSTYAAMLNHWISDASSPTATSATAPFIAELDAMGVIVNDESGIGCYPFNAAETEIHVCFAGKRVYAQCAIDALAIPRLVQCDSCISAQCAACGDHISCAVSANGSVENGNNGDDALRVTWAAIEFNETLSRTEKRISLNFVCARCAIALGTLTFSIPQAAAIGHIFFAFQRHLLTLQAEACPMGRRPNAD